MGHIQVPSSYIERTPYCVQHNIANHDIMRSNHFKLFRAFESLLHDIAVWCVMITSK